MSTDCSDLFRRAVDLQLAQHITAHSLGSIENSFRWRAESKARAWTNVICIRSKKSLQRLNALLDVSH